MTPVPGASGDMQPEDFVDGRWAAVFLSNFHFELRGHPSDGVGEHQKNSSDQR